MAFIIIIIIIIIIISLFLVTGLSFLVLHPLNNGDSSFSDLKFQTAVISV